MSTGGSRTADYEFDLPPERIAQFPLARRDDSRLMIVDRQGGSITHGRFADLAGIIPAGDALVLNDSRVIKARLTGTRESGAPAEVMLLEPRAGGEWEALVRPGARLKPGRRVQIAEGVAIVVGEAAGDGTRLVRFEGALSVEEILHRYGHVPLPPYIDRADTPEDAERYQTVYAMDAGSVAAPTAGLHFTPELLAALDEKGVRRATVTLHVGAGTFKPVESEEVAGITLHSERFSLGAATAAMLNDTRRTGKKIWAVGTTTLRVLETLAGNGDGFESRSGTTNIFIHPPHAVRGADHLVTNFHLPRSTLMMLVAAFAGYDLTRHAYAVAVAEGYRFYSYGDAMCIL
jgi:S-adenosylmethionine:tRNA ribosyltransferase-isomerase